ncbi:hypothetical protein V3N99_06450 [Dermatophilaceae bacterium Soc4.6]
MTNASGDVARPPSHDHQDRTLRTAELVTQLHKIVRELEEMHPGRRFPIDGHLVGSIGEAAAEALFDLHLVKPSATGHDAIAGDGRHVEIKATYGTRSVAIRETSHAAASALIVLRLSGSPQVRHEVVFNGPLAVALRTAGATQSNGQAKMSLSRLRALDATVALSERVPLRQDRSIV